MYYNVLTVILVIVIVLIILKYRENFTPYTNDGSGSPDAWKFVLPGKPKDLISNYNSDLGNCLLRRLDDKQRVCNSVVGVVPFPQLSYDPKNFTDF